MTLGRWKSEPKTEGDKDAVAQRELGKSEREITFIYYIEKLPRPTKLLPINDNFWWHL